MTAAIYTRVSTKDGKQDTDNQALQLRRFCEAQGWEITQEYRDQESGGTSERSQFQAMTRDASQRRFDVLLFWSLDRFSREGTLATLKYLELLESYGVHWRSFTEAWIDSAGPFRDVVISLIATLAKQEPIRLAERVRAGMERARLKATKSGKAIGRPRRIFDREQVLALRQKGLSWPEIARRLGVGQGTVVRAYHGLADTSEPFQNPAA